MNDEKLERLLKEVYSQDIKPSEELVQKVKLPLYAMKRPKKVTFEQWLLALAISINLVIFLTFVGFVASVPLGLAQKAAIYMGVTCLYNSLALAAYVQRDRLSEFFRSIGTLS